MCIYAHNNRQVANERKNVYLSDMLKWFVVVVGLAVSLFWMLNYVLLQFLAWWINTNGTAAAAAPITKQIKYINTKFSDRFQFGWSPFFSCLNALLAPSLACCCCTVRMYIWCACTFVMRWMRDKRPHLSIFGLYDRFCEQSKTLEFRHYMLCLLLPTPNRIPVRTRQHLYNFYFTMFGCAVHWLFKPTTILTTIFYI